MSNNQFDNATVHAKANIYFDGKVVSRTIITAAGERKTLGVMQLGQYHFNTGASEIMELLAGHCRVKLSGDSHWTEYGAGQEFTVAANSAFDIEVDALLDYICHFGN